MKSLFKLSGILLATSLLFAGCTFPWTKQAGLSVNILNEEKAQVFLNGVKKGETPFQSDKIKPGVYTVKIQPTDSAKPPYETSLNFNPGLLTVLNWTFGATTEDSVGESYELKPISGKKTELQIITIPDNAIVRLDGQSKGFSPLILEDVGEGVKSLTISAPGYLERTISPKVIKGNRLTVTMKLAREPLVTATPAPVPSVASPTPTASPKPGTSPSPTPKATAKPGSSPTATPKPVATPSPTPATTSQTIERPYIEVGTTPTGWLRVRAEANGTAAEVAKLNTGVKVPYLGELNNGWYKVAYETGKEGWVSAQYGVLYNK